MSAEVTRRSFIKTSAGAVGAMAFSKGGAQLPSGVPPLRVIHMTDHHLMEFMNARGSREGIEAAYAHAMRFQPDYILNGGDMLTHGMTRSLEDVKKDAETFLSLLPKRGPRIINACGNHDIWGWIRRRSGASGTEPLFGKNFFKEYFGEGHVYRSVDLGTWTVLVLDSVQPWSVDRHYQGGLDEEQFEWLKGELEGSNKNKPVLILSHIPILNSGIVLQDARLGPDARRGVTIPKGSCHQDLWRVTDALYRHGNVKIALSGHVHVDERTQMLGTCHISSGAVCGSWWRPREDLSESATRREIERGNPHLLRPPRADPGIGLFNLYPDGSYDYRYELIPWEFTS